MSFKDNLRKNRTRADFSQENLAEKMDVSRQTISKWENGDSYPSTEHIFMLTKILNCSADELISGNPSPTAKKNPRQNLGKLATAFIAIFLIFGFLTINNHQNENTIFSKIVDGSLDATLTTDGYTKDKIVGYGIDDENHTFYVKCDLKNSVGNPCSAIIYFCGENNSWQCQYLDDPDYLPSGEYRHVS